MDIIIRQAKILDPKSSHHNKIRNVHIKNGVIVGIGTGNFDGKNIINGKGMILTPGLFDMRANFADPGYEHKEDIASGCTAAAAGGFTGVALLPNTQPVIQTKSQVEYILRKSEAFLPDVHPIAAITTDTKGEDLTEMIDLHHAGAIAFTDGDHASWHTDILLKSLIYVQKFNGLIVNRPEDKMLTRFGDMHEGVTSTMLGLNGMPALAEELMIKRDLDILEYTGGKIHIANISTKGAVALIKEAKKKKLKVTCDVNIHHLIFDESHLSEFDTNYKSNPPFRTKQDQKALIKGVKEGIIDAIVSGHQPQDTENKKLEFDLAAFGLTGLQTLVPALNMISHDLSFEDAIDKLTHNPRNILALPETLIENGQSANVTLIDPAATWKLDKSSNYSKSENTPFFNQELTGRVVTTINGKKQFLAKELSIASK